MSSIPDSTTPAHPASTIKTRPLDTDPTLENLISIVETIAAVQREDITRETEFVDLDLDSLDHARLISTCEEAFEIELPQEAHATTTVEALYQMILATHL